jgi:hypothetical protein
VCVLVGDVGAQVVRQLLARYGLDFELEADDAAIRGTFWGEPEAGIAGGTVYARNDTPLHSVLHETAHIVCMTAERRARLDTDAGGDDLEESAVCYLQILLADRLDGAGRDRLMRDMDAWGYSFRLGSTRRWFLEDADDARAFLEGHGIVGADGQPTWTLR